MSDLIDRAEAIAYIENWKEVNKYYHPHSKSNNIPIDEVIQTIKDVPSVENQKTGHWIDDEFGTRCSCCNIHTHLDKFGRPMILLHCSFCGAKMEGE